MKKKVILLECVLQFLSLGVNVRVELVEKFLLLVTIGIQFGQKIHFYFVENTSIELECVFDLILAVSMALTQQFHALWNDFARIESSFSLRSMFMQQKLAIFPLTFNSACLAKLQMLSLYQT